MVGIEYLGVESNQRPRAEIFQLPTSNTAKLKAQEQRCFDSIVESSDIPSRSLCSASIIIIIRQTGEDVNAVEICQGGCRNIGQEQ